MIYSERVNKTFDNLINNINMILDEFSIAYTYHDLGQQYICNITDETDVYPQFSIGNGIHIEWPSISEVKLFKNNYPFFLVEVFHSRLVQEWQNCLNDIYLITIDVHFSPEKKLFPKYNTQNVKINFKSDEPLIEQIKDACKSDFDLKKGYSEKISLIKKTFDTDETDADLKSHLDNIFKNVEMRNKIQHNCGIIDYETLKNLNKINSKIEILDSDGNSKDYGIGDKIELSFPEFYYFKNSIIHVIQKWRENDEYN